MVVSVVKETHNESLFGNIYPARYTQMISSIRKGLLLPQLRCDVVVRLRPDAGMSGINGILSLNTWKSLTRIPFNSIAQYGTWKMRDGQRVNGDNCFAAQWNTFETFIFWWERLPSLHYKAYSNHNHIEWTMNEVVMSHNLTLLSM